MQRTNFQNWQSVRVQKGKWSVKGKEERGHEAWIKRGKEGREERKKERKREEGKKESRWDIGRGKGGLTWFRGHRAGGCHRRGSSKNQ